MRLKLSAVRPETSNISWEEIYMSKRSLFVLLIPVFACAIVTAQESPLIHQPTLTPQDSGTTNGLISVWPVNPQVVWACGRNGTFTLTTDGGQTWNASVVPGAETLQFRDVQAFSASVAYLMSIGANPADFRIYKTTDGGATWTMQFENQNPNAFYDGFAFWTPNRGIAHSDSFNGVFPDLRTTDGMTWQDISNNMPPALPGEGSFASSGTCVTTQGGRNAWIATGVAAIARVLATRDQGNTWNAYDTPLFSSPSAGAFTIAFRDPFNGIVGGGDLDPGDPNNARTATSSDGGQTWTLTTAPPVTGAIFGLSYVGRTGGAPGNNLGRAVVITANDPPTFSTGTLAWTPDEGNTWFTLPSVGGFWGVAFATPKAGWLVGTDGRILKISF
jgi:photosystem II stability/assembly factor-like uncharacterized protein